jgi:hypothetical protein
MLAAALPQLQQQLSEVLKEGISREEIEEVRKSMFESVAQYTHYIMPYIHYIMPYIHYIKYIY